MSPFLKLPLNNTYRRFVLFPLYILLVILTGYELKTGLIPDSLIGPAALYLVIAAARTGPFRWWWYPVSLVTIVFALCAIAVVGREFAHLDMIGGGAIKLMMAVGGAVGLAIGFETVILSFLPIVVALLFTKIIALPSSPLVAVALYFAIGRRYGFNFLFVRNQQPAPEAGPGLPVIDTPASMPAEPLNTQRLSFLKLPPTPSLLLQGGALLTFGGGFLSSQLQKTPDHSIVVALAIEGLRVASFVGIVCFVVGWVKTRKQK